jgi:hypothetical protein
LNILRAGTILLVDQMGPQPRNGRHAPRRNPALPGWENAPGEIPEAYFQRRQMEWLRADRIIVNWNIRESARAAGVQPENWFIRLLRSEGFNGTVSRRAGGMPLLAPKGL